MELLSHGRKVNTEIRSKNFSHYLSITVSSGTIANFGNNNDNVEYCGCIGWATVGGEPLLTLSFI